MNQYYEGIPFEEYNKWEGLSGSGMEKLRITPLHYQTSLTAPREPTPALTLGKATHTRILEPHLYAGKYAIAPECDKRTKIGKDTWADFVIENPGREIINATQSEKIESMATAVKMNKTALKLLAIPGDVELSMIWDDEQGTKCKGRPDKYCPTAGMFIELKTAASAAPEEFSKAAFKYGYHRKAAHIIDGMRYIPNTKQIENYVFIVVESEAPYAAAIYYLDPDAITLGHTDVEKLKSTYRKCLLDNEWPGYPQEIQTLNLPAWAYKEK